MIITMVAVTLFVTSKSHQKLSEGRGDVRVSARQLSLDLVWFFSCSDCTVQIVQCSAIRSYAVQCSVFSYSEVQFARELVRPGNSLCPCQARVEVTFASQRSPCLRTLIMIIVIIIMIILIIIILIILAITFLVTIAACVRVATVVTASGTCCRPSRF